MAEAPQNAAYAMAQAFFRALAEAGVRHVVVSPGSRSTPLAISAAREAGLRSHVHLDERAAGFYALGLAKGSGAPAALICTSGTAAANYLPAVVEAHYGRVPLIALTADRPPELREWGAGQTIDQVKIFGGHVRRSSEMPVADDSLAERGLLYAEAAAHRGVADALGASGGGPGPVHINWPLREPLEPAAHGDADRWRDAAEGPRRVLAPPQIPWPAPRPELLDSLAPLAKAHPRGVLICGPMIADARFAEAVTALSRATGWPLLADGVSSLRQGPHVEAARPLGAYDLWLRSEVCKESFAPTLVVRFGQSPVCKPLRLALEARPPEQMILVDPWGAREDHSRLATQVIAVDPTLFCDGFREALGEHRPDPVWADSWRAVDTAAEACAASLLAEEAELREAGATRVLFETLPEEAIVMASNSMPVRDIDAYAPVSRRAATLHCNRGANGIDGVVSTALGLAHGAGRRVHLLIGDLALLHDLGGWLAEEREGPGVTALVLDNGGGGIFSFLPIAAYGESVDFERLFHTPQERPLEGVAALHGLTYFAVGDAEELRNALEQSAAGAGSAIVHLRFDRDENIEQFRRIASAAADAGAERLP